MRTHPRLSAPAIPALRFPRQTLQLRLALLYGAVVFASGVVLLSIPNGFVLHGSASAAAPNQTLGPTLSNSQQGGASVHQLVVGSAVALVLLVPLSFLLGWFIAGRFLRPLRTITAAARDISASNLHRRLALGGPNDELTELGQTLDDLFGRLEAAFDSQRRFVANAAHELRTPLTAERTLLQVALADPTASAATLRTTCEEVLILGEQQARLIEALLTLASSERGIERWETLDLAAIAQEVALLRRQEAARRGIRFDVTFGTATTIGDPQLVESLVANLVDNALRYNVDSGWIELVTTAREGRATFQVRNTGPVVPEGEIERLLQPFQRLGNARVRHGDGLGLGLAIVQAIAKAHGAALSVLARPEGGLDITVAFSAPHGQLSEPGCANDRPSVART